MRIYIGFDPIMLRFDGGQAHIIYGIFVGFFAIQHFSHHRATLQQFPELHS